jgi:hypothetical protein
MSGDVHSELLTDTERELLTDERSEAEIPTTREALIQSLRQRFRSILADFELLYVALTDEELTTIFGGDETGDPNRGRIRASAQHSLSLLYLGLVLTDDDVEHRFASAITHAEAARERRATVDLEIITEPFLPPKKRLEALKQGGFQHVSADAFDQLFYDERVPADDVAALVSEIQHEAIDPEVIETERAELAWIERPPPVAVVNVSKVDPIEEAVDDQESNEDDEEQNEDSP